MSSEFGAGSSNTLVPEKAVGGNLSENHLLS